MLFASFGVSSLLLVTQVVLFGEIAMLRYDLEREKEVRQEDVLSARIDGASSTARVVGLLGEEVKARYEGYVGLADVVTANSEMNQSSLDLLTTLRNTHLKAQK